MYTDLCAISSPGIKRREREIENIRFITEEQQHVPENTVVPEHILALQVCSGAPAMNNADKLVRALRKEGGQVELTGIVASFRIADICAVQVQVNAAGHAQERNNGLSRLVRYVDKTAVHADRIVFILRCDPMKSRSGICAHCEEDPAGFFGRRNHWRSERKLISGVEIEWLCITGKLPAGRNLYPVKRQIVRIKHRGQFLRIPVKAEIPLTAQHLSLVRSVSLFPGFYSLHPFLSAEGDEIASGKQSIVLNHIKVMIILSVQYIFHVPILRPDGAQVSRFLPICVVSPSITFLTHCNPVQPSRSKRMNSGIQRQQWEVAPLDSTGRPLISLKL